MKKVIFAVALTIFLVGNCFALRLPAVPKERCIEIYGEIRQENVEKIMGKFIELDKTDGDIRIYINSPGGHVVWGVPVLETLMTLHNDVQVIAFAHVSSMALPILAIGTKGKRAITPATFSYVHQIYIEKPTPSFFPFPEDEVEEWEQDRWWKERKVAKLLRKAQIYLDQIIYDHSRVTFKELAEWDENWIYAETILKYELADGYYTGELRGE